MQEISKGKWQHVRKDGPEGRPVAYITANDVCIAVIHSTRDGKDNKTRKREAFGNGEIMAASGALLVACRAMRQFLIERHGYDECPDDWPDTRHCLIEANAAISQAEERHEWPEGK